MMKKIWKLIYDVKYTQKKKVIRILCFKFKFSNKTPMKFMPYIPNITHIGKCSYSGQDIYITNKEETIIGSFTSIGTGVSLGCGRHPINFLSTSPYLYADYLGYKKKMASHNEYVEYCPPIKVGNDVWIGDKVLIMNGVTIGDGAIIGAHAVVTKDVPPYAIVGGIPAKIIRYRFDKESIEELLKLKWWNFPDEIIKKIPYDDITKAILFLKRQLKQDC